MVCGQRRPTVWNILVIVLVVPLLETNALSRKARILEEYRDSRPLVDFTDRNTIDGRFAKPVDDKEYEMLEPNYSYNDEDEYLRTDREQREDGHWNLPEDVLSHRHVVKRKRRPYANFNKVKVNSEDFDTELVDHGSRSVPARSYKLESPLRHGTRQVVYLPRRERDWTGDSEIKFAEDIPSVLGYQPPLALGNQSPIELGDRFPISLDNQAPVKLGDRFPIALDNQPVTALNDRPPIELGNQSLIALGDRFPTALDNWPPIELGNRTPIALSDQFPTALDNRIPIELGDQTLTAFDDRPQIELGNRTPIALGDRTMIALNNRPPIELADPTPIVFRHHHPAAVRARHYLGRPAEQRHHSPRRNSDWGVHTFNNHRQYRPLRVTLPSNLRPAAAYIVDANGMIRPGQIRYAHHHRRSKQNAWVHKREKVPSEMATTAAPNGGTATKAAPNGGTATKAVPNGGTRTKPALNGGTANRTATQNGTDTQDDVAGVNLMPKSSHQYQVIVKPGKTPPNVTDATAANVPRGNGTDEDSKRNMLKEIILELEGFKPRTGGGPAIVVMDNSPCSILGSWTSNAGGVRFDIAAYPGSSMLNVSIAKTIPPKRDPWLNSSEWNFEGESPFTDRGLFTLTAVHKTQHRVATFTGQCVKCAGEELVAGVWSTGRSARNCRDTIVAYGDKPDVFRREVLHILRAQRQRELAKAANETTTVSPVTHAATESSKKAKRWWEETED